jgi:hypothetical protein
VREQYGDLWQMGIPVICITTNGSLVRIGPHTCRYRGVMGRGVAKQAKDRYPHIEEALGMSVHGLGNHVDIIRDTHDSDEDHTILVSFPVKYEWHARADLVLIERSCYELMAKVLEYGWHDVVLPRPGCGNGGLQWVDVEPICRRILGDQIIVVDR